MHKRSVGSQAELVAKQYYIDKWWLFTQANFTIRGWEIDLIFCKGAELLFVEVKLVNYVEDITGYITPKKKIALKRTIREYIRLRWKLHKSMRVDVVYVKGNSIYQLYENIVL